MAVADRLKAFLARSFLALLTGTLVAGSLFILTALARMLNSEAEGFGFLPWGLAYFVFGVFGGFYAAPIAPKSYLRWLFSNFIYGYIAWGFIAGLCVVLLVRHTLQRFVDWSWFEWVFGVVTWIAFPMLMHFLLTEDHPPKVESHLRGLPNLLTHDQAKEKAARLR